jgi:phosphopantothenoylcysteine decarboxylase/phosphopantothenate--cysteine ligase
VTLVYGRGTVPPPEQVRVIRVETTQEMRDAVTSELRATKYDIVIAAAAVADWTPAQPKQEKIPTQKAETLTIRFLPTPKIADEVKPIRPDTFLVLFKAEHGVSDNELVERAFERLKTAKADLIVANDVARPGVGFDVATNELFIVDKKKAIVHVPRTTKAEAAQRLLDVVASKLT